MTTTSHAITSLTLENFRNYRTLSLSLDTRPVVLRGANGAGKTNILEAISMLSPGRGLRGAKLSEMDSIGAGEAPWVVASTLRVRDEDVFIGTGRDNEANTDKRIIKINGEKVRGHQQLAAHTCIQWLTPAMDQIFTEGGSARRKFLDRLVYGFTPEHAARVTAHENAMRERNRLLADGIGRADPHWLSVLEQQMAEHAVAITLARLETCDRLMNELEEDIAGFPRARLRLIGTIEAWLENEGSALEAEQRFAERLANIRITDAARGRASEGVHRSELEVIHNVKNMEAGNCSTGEQKALLLSLLLAAARARANWCGTPPILLLDEVIAHLDETRRASLFELVRQSGIQAWMTGTDAADFSGLEGDATELVVEDGSVQQKGR
jgi:DNA replication and repair protein RecF